MTDPAEGTIATSRSGTPPLGARPATASVLRHGLLLIATFLMLYPLLWMVASSFKPESIIFTDLSIWPPAFDFGNYVKGWTALQSSTPRAS